MIFLKKSINLLLSVCLPQVDNFFNDDENLIFRTTR